MMQQQDDVVTRGDGSLENRETVVVLEEIEPTGLYRTGVEEGRNGRKKKKRQREYTKTERRGLCANIRSVGMSR